MTLILWKRFTPLVSPSDSPGQDSYFLRMTNAGTSVVFLHSEKVNTFQNQCRVPCQFGTVPESADPFLWLMDPAPDPAFFVIDLQNANKIRSRYPTVLQLLPSPVVSIRDVWYRSGSADPYHSLEWFSAYLFWEGTRVHSHHFSKMKSHKKVTKQ